MMMRESGYLMSLEKSKIIKIIKYTISSMGSSAVELIIFHLMVTFIDYAHIILIATIIGRLIGSIINFIINKYWCFKVYNRTLIQSILFSILFIFKLFMSYFLVNMIVDRYDLNPTLIKIPVDIFLFFFGYVIQNFVIFRKKEKENQE